MLERVLVEHFKSLRKIELEVRPLTILMGRNSSGKSSLFQCLAFLKQSIPEPRTFDFPFKLDGPLVDMGSYRDMVYQHETTESIHIAFDVRLRKKEQETIQKILKRKKIIPKMFGSWDLKLLTCSLYFHQPRPELNEWSISLQITDNTRSISIHTEGASRLWTGTFDQKELKINQNMGSFLPTRGGGTTLLVDLCEAVIEPLEQHLRHSWFFLRARRGTLRYDISITEAIPADVGASGENTVAILAYMRDKDQFQKVLSKINYWWKQLGQEKLVPTLEQKDRYAIRSTDPITKIQSNLVNTGFGFNQLLPVIVQSFYGPVGSTIFIEQPEISLHPRMASKLVDFFIDVLKFGNQLVVETHSEHVLIRLQRRIAEKKLSPDDVILYYFEMTKEGTKVKPIVFDEYGALSDDLPGFFVEDFEEVINRLKAIGKRKRESNE